MSTDRLWGVDIVRYECYQFGEYIMKCYEYEDVKICPNTCICIDCVIARLKYGCQLIPYSEWIL